MWHKLRQWAFTVLVALAAVGIVFTFWAHDRYVVPILTYHHIGEEGRSLTLNHVTSQSFAWQMKFLHEHDYNVIGFNDYIEGTKKGRAFARNTVVIQFDDGYDDNYLNAFPVLKQYAFPASIYLVSDSIGTAGFLTWDQVKEMEAHGIEFGAHTRNHAYLPELSLDKARDEIFGSKKVIEQHLGHPIKYFVYPSGGFTDDVQTLVKEAGFQAACTTNRGRDRFNRRLFEINRIRVKNENVVTFWVKLTGYYNLFRKSRYSGDDKGHYE